MSSLISSGSATGTGAVTLIPTSSNNNQTVTLPDATGTVMVTGNMPAFSAYASTATSLSNGTLTKVNFDTKEFDTNTNYSTSTSRFTPTVAGYYQIGAQVAFSGIVTSETVLAIYKSGSLYKQMNDQAIASSGTYTSSGSCLVYCNGSTDYIEIYVYQNSSRNSLNNSTYTFFQGAMVRAA